VLEVRNLRAFYGESLILDEINLTVGQSGRVAVLGRNGAGKTTLLKSIMNAGPRVDGEVEFDGKILGNTAAFRRARLGVSLVPEDRRIFTHISVAENIEMARYGVPAGRTAWTPQQILQRFPMLSELGARLGGQLSGGQQQMLAVARSIAARPRLLLLDEPTEGLAPVIVESMAKDVAASCAQDGMALLLSEQNLWFARQCTDYVYVLDTGRIVFHGDWPTFERNDDIKHHYLAI
jgi:branched-chain amino acid transport system ATP-binding protein